MGLLQQCTKVHVHGLGPSAGVLYDTIMAYVTCLYERKPVDSVKPMFDPVTPRNALISRLTLLVSQVFGHDGSRRSLSRRGRRDWHPARVRRWRRVAGSRQHTVRQQLFG
jgi:hypothetical protein